ncbi:MAG: hypothetical protein UMU75_03030 [Halomonas sp.]|nr:hypothetical protein [Halomonas sp.]
MDKTHRTADTARARLGVGTIYRTEPVVAMTRRKDEGPMSVSQAANARREVEYVARRNGLKEPLLQLWKILH